jgi:hypothetical protein
MERRYQERHLTLTGLVGVAHRSFEPRSSKITGIVVRVDCEDDWVYHRLTVRKGSVEFHRLHRGSLDGYEEVLLGALSGERSSVCLSFGRAIKTGTGWPPNQEVYDKCKQIYDGDSE